MAPYFDMVVVIPVGPDVEEAFIADTLNSLAYFTSRSYKVILLDDSQKNTGVNIKKQFPDIDLLPTVKNYGSWCGLYISLSLAYRHALEHYDFIALLKLDTDALIIGSNPEEEAINLFQTNPLIGMAGQYPREYNGKPWDIGWPRRRILNGTRSWKYLRRPVANWLLTRFYNKALKNGYTTGESVFGGAYFMSKILLNRLLVSGLLPNFKFKTLNLGEDHLFSLLVKALGFQLGDLSTGSLPFGCSWRGLPDSPQRLAEYGKKIIHSTKGWMEMSETDIRKFFSQQRTTA